MVAQLALSFVLLIGAALMLRSFARLREVEAGFRTENVLTAEVHLNWARLLTSERRMDIPKINAFHDALHERVRGLPGVSQVALAWTIPLNSAFHQHDGTFQIEGRHLEKEQGLPRAESRGAGPAYFEALGVPLVRGRGFVEQDRGEAPLVMVVSQSLARRHFGEEDPVGRRISFDGETWGTIVGVAGDVRNIALDQEPE